MTESFTSISVSADFVDAVLLDAGEDGAKLAVTLMLKNGRDVDPAAVLSEANLDLLALLITCAVAEASAEQGQSRFLVFDDVFQSVDTIYRERACSYLANHFRDWQLVFCTHDRLWLSVLAETLRQANHPFTSREITRWAFMTGPVIREARVAPEASLQRALDDGDPVLICATAGLLLEETADRLSWVLPTSVTRRRADRYTLGDLWPGVAKKLKKTRIASIAEDVTQSAVFRNLVGAHFNEWARSLSTAEASRFGSSVLALVSAVRCGDCGTWLLPGGDSAVRWTCKCGAVALE